MSSSAAFFLLAAFAQAGMFEAVEPHMGTLVRIKLCARDAQEADRAFRKAFDRIAELDAILSDYKSDSELNRVCRDAVARPMEISDDLFRVLSAAQDFAAKSEGAFDPTVGPLSRLWRRRQVPDAAEIREALRHTGFRKVHLDAFRNTVLLDEPGMILDLGGIAKGYAADEALTALRRLGISAALVAVSGDLALGDPPPGERGWKIAVGDGLRELRNCGVSTSGDSEQHVDSGGVRYSHILDPATGMGLTGSITVTVIAPRGIDADGLSTAISVLGTARGGALIRQYTGAEMAVHGASGVPLSAKHPR